MVIGQKLRIYPNDLSIVYTDFWPFYCSTRTAFVDMNDIKRQLSVDIPRCDFYVDGDRTTELPTDMNSTHCLCTQAVLAPFVEAMSTPGVFLAECARSKRMRVEIWANELVLVHKQLCVRSMSDPSLVLYELSINVSICLPLERIVATIGARDLAQVNETEPLPLAYLFDG